MADPTGGQWDHWSDLPDLYDDDDDETTALKPRKRFFATCEKERRLSGPRMSRACMSAYEVIWR